MGGAEKMNTACTRRTGQEAPMQHGSVVLAGRKFGPDVWQFPWSEKDQSGRRMYRSE